MKLRKSFILGIIIALLIPALETNLLNKADFNSSLTNLLAFKTTKFPAGEKKYQLAGYDGPYIFNKTLYRVNANNELEKATIKQTDPILVKVNNQDSDSFYFKLKDEITVFPDTYEMPKKLIAISDIEGNFNAFVSFLKNNKIIDNNYNWIFGKGHLVLVGDFFDRGKNVMPVLWLIYKLETEAKKDQGAVHFVLGNHELMNLQGKYKYNRGKYREIARLIYQDFDSEKASQADYTKFLYSAETELGKWLRSKNGIEKIGNYLFVHAGLSPKLLDYNLSLSEINKISRNNLDKNLYQKPQKDKKANFLLGHQGIFWYRGFFMKYKDYYSQIKEEELDQLLAYYKAKKVVVGHTIIADKIVSIFNNKIIDIDIHHGKEKNSGKTKGLLIENGIEYQLNDLGQKEKFKSF